MINVEKMPNGNEMYYMYIAGNKVLVAEYDAERGEWL